MRINQETSSPRRRAFNEQLRAFRERDKALNDALVSAHAITRGSARAGRSRWAMPHLPGSARRGRADYRRRTSRAASHRNRDRGTGTGPACLPSLSSARWWPRLRVPLFSMRSPIPRQGAPSGRERVYQSPRLRRQPRPTSSRRRPGRADATPPRRQGRLLPTEPDGSREAGLDAGVVEQRPRRMTVSSSTAAGGGAVA